MLYIPSGFQQIQGNGRIGTKANCRQYDDKDPLEDDGQEIGNNETFWEQDAFGWSLQPSKCVRFKSRAGHHRWRTIRIHPQQ